MTLLRFHLDAAGKALGHLLGVDMPALWMRPQGRTPSPEECRTLFRSYRLSREQLFWRVARTQPDPSVRAFGKYPALNAGILAESDIMARTALGKQDVPSRLVVADGTNLDDLEFADFTRDTLFGQLSGILLVPRSAAGSCLSRLEPLFPGWDATTRAQAEDSLVQFIRHLAGISAAPVLVVVDSNMTKYWVVPADAPAFDRQTISSFLVDQEEFDRWARIGWDLRFLQRPMLP